MVPFSEDALRRLGRILEGRGLTFRLIIVGGAALNLRGIVHRSTEDVDVIARIEGPDSVVLVDPNPLPAELLDAAHQVAADLELAPSWLNAAVATQGPMAMLPAGMLSRVEWRTYGSLHVGVAGRADLIALKLHAAVDRFPERKHFDDLLALQPSAAELEVAAVWVRAQDGGADFPRAVQRMVDRVEHHTH